MNPGLASCRHIEPCRASEWLFRNPHSSFFYPGPRVEWRGILAYHYPCAMMARPEYWNPRFRTGPEQWGNTYWHEVSYAESKSLLVDVFTVRTIIDKQGVAPARHGSTGILFVDGSVRGTAISQIKAGYQSADGLFPGSMHVNEVEPALHTIDGVRGVDANP